MFNFILGVIVTLAIVYPSASKHYFSAMVDTVHHVVDTAAKQKESNE